MSDLENKSTTQAEIFTDLLDEFITKKIEYSESIKEGCSYSTNIALELIDIKSAIADFIYDNITQL